MPEQLRSLAIMAVLTFISAVGDAQGFVHASRMWEGGRLLWMEVGKSAIGFSVGIVSYWFVVKYLSEFGVASPELQAVGWFATTIVGVALFSGKFLQWRLSDQIIGVAILLGLGWLMFRTGE